MDNLLKIMSFNCNGLAGNEKRRQVFNWLHNKDFSVLLLQESHSTENTENRWESEWGGKIIFAHGTSSERGVAFLFKNHVIANVHEKIRDKNGRFFILDVTLNDIRYTLVGVYGPNSDSPDFWGNVNEKNRTI